MVPSRVRGRRRGVQRPAMMDANMVRFVLGVYSTVHTSSSPARRVPRLILEGYRGCHLLGYERTGIRFLLSLAHPYSSANFI